MIFYLIINILNPEYKIQETLIFSIWQLKQIDKIFVGFVTLSSMKFQELEVFEELLNTVH